MSDEKIVFKCLSSAELVRDNAWWEIYDEAFPRSERESPQIILKSLERKVGLAIRASAGNTTIAIATTHLLKDPPAVFLVYLAIDRNMRGSGHGGRLLEFAWHSGIQRLSEIGLDAVGFVCEVDSPEVTDDVAEKHLRERRIAFFSRHGCKLLPSRYIQPPVDGSTLVPMRLMFRAAENHRDLELTLTKRLVRSIYFEKYNAINNISTETLENLLQKTESPVATLD
jgi:ribosomal protein S18 acetylase RimI-like enzyme